MYKELRHQVKIHRISEKLNKGIKICIYPPLSPIIFSLKKKENNENMLIMKRKKKSSPSL
jgi:hypothetical protein